MDQKKFKELIETYAEIKHHKPSTYNYRLDENSGGEVRYKGEWIEVGKDLNPTLGFDLKKLKPQPRLCELGCNKIIDNQVIEKRLLTYPEKHWRTKCSCGKQLGPNGEILKDNNHAMSAFAQYFKDKK